MMRRKPFLSPDKETFPDKREQMTTSLEGSSSIRKRSSQRQLEGSPPSTKDIAKCLVKKNRRDYLDTPFGITLSNCSLEPLHPYPVDSFPSPRAKSLRRRSL